MTRPSRGSLLVAAVLGGLLLTVFAPPALGHAEYQRSSPHNGQLLNEAPTHVNVSYNEEIFDLNQLEVVDADNQRVPQGEPRIDETAPNRVLLPLGNLSEGLYTVRWSAEGVDGHNVSGAFFFLIGEETPDRSQLLETVNATSTGTGGTNPYEASLRGLALLSTVVLIGAPITARWVLGSTLGTPGDRTRSRARWLAWLAVGGLGVAGLGLAAWTSRWEAGFVSRMAGVGLAAVGLRGSHAERVGGGWSVLGGLAAVVGGALSSHAGSLLGAEGGFVAIVHVLGGGLWVGGAIALAVLVSPWVSEAGAEGDGGLGAVIARFSVVAVVGAGLAVAAGLGLAGWFVPAWSALSETVYGVVLSGKGLLVVGAFGLGGLHRLVTWRQARRGLPVLESFSRSVGVEAVLLAGAVVASGVLASAPTAVSQAPAANALDAPLHQDVRYSGGLDGSSVRAVMEVGLEVRPGQAGLNVFDVSIFWRGEPMPEVERVEVSTLQLAESMELPAFGLDRHEPGVWTGVSALSISGVWSVQVSFLVNGTFQRAVWEVYVPPSGGVSAGVAEGVFSGWVHRVGWVVLGLTVVGVAVEVQRRDWRG